MTQAYAILLDQVKLVRKSWRVRRALEGIVLLLAVAVGVAALAVMLDHAAALGEASRWVAFLVIVAAVVGVAVVFLLRPLSARHTDDYFAALVEQRQPSMRNRLINALQLGREAAPHSPRLVEAIISDGAIAADDLDASHAVAGPAMKRFALGLGAVLAAAAIYGFFAGPAAAVGARRVLMPWADILPFTWTTLDVSPGKPQMLLEGSPLTVHARTGGRYPDEAMLHWTDAQGHRRGVRMSGEKPDFTHTFAALDAGFRFYVTAGDARSRTIAVSVEPRPRVARMSVKYHYPSYTALPEREVKEFDGHLHGLPQTRITLTIAANKPLDQAAMILDGRPPASLRASGDPAIWTTEMTLTKAGVYRFRLSDQKGNELDDAARYTITLEQDAPPVVGFSRPARDIQVKPEEAIDFGLVAQDDFGLGPVSLVGRVNPDKSAKPDPVAIQTWANGETTPLLRQELNARKTVAELGLKAGDRMEYWATAADRNEVSPEGPGRGESRHFNILVLTPDQSQKLLESQLIEYAKVIGELIRQQRVNRTESADFQPAAALVTRQAAIRKGTAVLAGVMRKNAFPAQTMIDELRGLASDQMAKTITMLESYRDTTQLDASKAFATSSLPVQDEIIARLEEMLQRLNRDQAVREQLKKIAKTDQAAHKEVQASMGKLAKDLDAFLAQQRDLKDKYEKLTKRDGEESKGEDPAALADARHRLDRWKQWAKDSVDAITKLPEGFVNDTQLAETLPAIFEDIEKKKRGATEEIATPSEEGMKIISTKVLEDLEVWMAQSGDAVKWAMEEPPEGKFAVQPAPLPSNMQDLIGDLIEDLDEFDEEADDVTSSWGGDLPQGGWDIVDGPLSTFSGQGKTGNQMPNAQEITGRTGAGRRGRSSGQMQGDESTGMEGRPTPARATNEKYQEGNPKTKKQLDPRGATGGGKKAGGGMVGLQGGTKPDFVKDMTRLSESQQQLRERAQQVAKQLENAGRSSSKVNRALRLLESSEQDLRDLKYEDAARKRKTAISELKAEQNPIDEAVNLSLQKANNLPPEMRREISNGARQALPEGYEDLVGAYYKALSGSGE